MAHVVDRVAQHDEPGKAQAEGKATPLLGIDAPGAQHVRMNQAAGEKLDPGRSLADTASRLTEGAARIELEARLDEGEMTRAQTNIEIPLEDPAQERLHGSDQMRDRDVLANDHSLHLIEGVIMACVGRLLSEYTARRNDAEGRLALFHGSDLNRGGMSAKNQTSLFVAIEGVLGISRGVVLRNVQGFEVVVIELDFRSVEHLVTHGDEEVFELPGHLGDGMKTAATGLRSGHGGIETVCPTRGIELSGFEGLLAFADQFEDGLLEAIRLLAVGLAICGLELRNLGQHGRHEPLLADEFALDVLECDLVRARPDALARFLESVFGIHGDAPFKCGSRASRVSGKPVKVGKKSVRSAEITEFKGSSPD